MTLFPAERIKELRESKKIKQSQLAKDLKISQSTMSEYESGVKQPPVSMLSQIADYFNVSLDYLAGRTDTKFTIKTLQDKLVTKSGLKISLNDLVKLEDDEKKVVAYFLRVVNKHNTQSVLNKRKKK